MLLENCASFWNVRDLLLSARMTSHGGKILFNIVPQTDSLVSKNSLITNKRKIDKTDSKEQKCTTQPQLTLVHKVYA